MAPESWAITTDAFEQAAHWFVRTAARGDGRWDSPALDLWTVRDLVGHTSRALLTVETCLGREAAIVDVDTPEDYFRRALAAIGDPGAVAQRGRDAGVALGPDPGDSVAEIATRVLATVRVASGDDLVTTPVGGMRLRDYLPTRTFELTVHTCDLAMALDEPLDVPAAAAVASVHLLGALAARAGQAGPLLLAATGRAPLPTGFTVL